MRLFFALEVFLSLLFVTRSEAGQGRCVPGQVGDYSASYRSFKTGYFPDDSLMEGGFKDRNGRPLRTLQAYLRGQADYVSVAMDHTDSRLPYGTLVRIPDVERYFGRCIEFRVVDTGGRFAGRGTEKIDICNDSEGNANSGFSNGWSQIYVVGRGGGPGKVSPRPRDPEDEDDDGDDGGNDEEKED